MLDTTNQEITDLITNSFIWDRVTVIGDGLLIEDCFYNNTKEHDLDIQVVQYSLRPVNRERTSTTLEHQNKPRNKYQLKSIIEITTADKANTVGYYVEMLLHGRDKIINKVKRIEVIN